MKILICCSKKFYDKIEEVKVCLESMGHSVTLPNSFDDPLLEIRVKEESEKEHAKLVKSFLLESKQKVAKCDAILVLNFDAKGIRNYIGGATFLEIYMAFDAGKKIFLCNEPTQEIFLDEINGISPVILNGDFSLIGGN